MSSGTNALRRAASRIFKELGVTVLSERGHRGHIVYELEHHGVRWKHGIPGSPSTHECVLNQLRKRVSERVKEKA